MKQGYKVDLLWMVAGQDAASPGGVYRGVMRIRNRPPPQDPTIGLCPGHYGGPRGWALSYERGTPVAVPQSGRLHTPFSRCHAAFAVHIRQFGGGTKPGLAKLGSANTGVPRSQETPTPPGLPQVPKHRATEGSNGGGVSYERCTPVPYEQLLRRDVKRF